MKNTNILIKRTAIITGLFLGSFVLAVVAGEWVGPSTLPPGGNVEAPINVGPTTQSKPGRLDIGQLNINTSVNDPYATGLTVFGKSVFNGQVQINSGSPGLNKVLTSDADGNAGWRDLSTLPAENNAATKICYIYNGGDNWFFMFPVQNRWTKVNCRDAARQNFWPFNGTSRYGLGCVFESGTVSFTMYIDENNTNSTEVPNPNCGW